MTWEYSKDPATSDKDAVRFLIQDVDDASPIVQDEEIDWLLLQNTNIYFAAAAACEAIAARYRAAATSKSVGGLSISYATRSDEFAAQAALLRAQGTSSGTGVPVPVWTAGSIDEKEQRWADDDLNHVDVYIGMHDNHGAGASGG